MSISLGEPHLLASYAIPRRKAFTASSASFRYTSVTHSRGKEDGGYATISVEGRGVDIVELHNMHPVASHTLGPSAHFLTSAVTRFDETETTSYAIVQDSPQSDSSASGNIITRWCNHLNAPTENYLNKKFVTCPKPPKMLLAPKSLPKHIVGLSFDGDVMIISDDACTVSLISGKPSPRAVLLKGLVFEALDCSFLPKNLYHTEGVLVLCFIFDLGKITLRITPITVTGEVGQSLECVFGGIGIQSVVDISCDFSGYTTILTHQSTWHLYRLSHDGKGSLIANSLTKPLHLSGLTFLSAFEGDLPGLCVVSTGQSFVLLAGFVKGSSSDIMFLLWDVQFSVVLGSHLFTLPSNLIAQSQGLPYLSLMLASPSNALFVVSPPSDRVSSKKTARSAVYIIPLSLPLSSIALAIGKAKQSQKWLQNYTDGPVIEDPNRRGILQTIQKLLKEGQAEEAEKEFWTWIEANKGQNQGVNEDSQKHSKLPLSYTFVSHLLETVFEDSKKSYPRRIVEYLLKQKVIGNNMVGGGILPLLQERNDWDLALLSLDFVPDLPESDVICLVACAVQRQRQRRTTCNDHMQIEEDDSGLLQSLLIKVVEYRMSGPMVRLALKQQLSNAQDVTYLLSILAQWLRWAYHDEAKLGEFAQKGLKMPSVSAIVEFIQRILDAHFLLLLQYKSSHSILSTLAEVSNQHLTTIGELEGLSGPLESFTKAALRESTQKRIEEDDKRKKRKQAFETSELAIGQYQIENIAL